MNRLSIIFNVGSQAGLVAFGLYLLYYFSGNCPIGAISWFSLPVLIYFIRRGIIQVRQEDGGGFISYGRALNAGFMIGFVYASLHGMLAYLFDVTISHNLLTSFIEQHNYWVLFFKDTIIEGQGQEVYDNVLIAYENHDLQDIIMENVESKFFGGVFISLVAAWFLKKNPNFEGTT